MTKNQDSKDSFEEWLDGFTSTPYTDHQLNEIKSRADRVSPGEVEQLVKEIELFRSLLKSLLEYSENREKESGLQATEGTNQNQLFGLIRFMLSERK